MIGFIPVGKNQIRSRIPAWALLPVLLACGGTSYAQESPAPAQPAQPALSQAQTINSVAVPCVQPPPIVQPQDYTGPFKKTIGALTQQLERKSVHPIHYKPGVMLCSLELKDKFFLFVRDSFDPATFLISGFNAGLSQAENNDPTFGQGIAGYSKRFGASYADQATFRFFKDFAYPSMFHEDPRYYRLIYGSNRKRFLHAIEHAFVAHRDNGNHMFNFSEWLGTTSAISLGNVYHPGNERGFAPSAEAVGFSVLTDMGYDELREFWPEISRKFRLPFRTEPTAEDSDSGPLID